MELPPVTLTVKDFKATFFNLAAITDPLEKAKQTGARDSASLVRKIARESMRWNKSKKNRAEKSPAGTAPLAEKGFIRNLLYFAWEPERDTAVVGPAFLPSKSNAGSTTVPGVHEKAGSLSLTRKVFDLRPKAKSKAQAAAFRRKMKDGSLVREPRYRTENFTAKYPKRSFMVPALERAKVVMKEFFKLGG